MWPCHLCFLLCVCLIETRQCITQPVAKAGWCKAIVFIICFYIWQHFALKAKRRLLDSSIELNQKITFPCILPLHSSPCFTKGGSQKQPVIPSLVAQTSLSGQVYLVQTRSPWGASQKHFLQSVVMYDEPTCGSTNQCWRIALKEAQLTKCQSHPPLQLFQF